MHMFLCLKGLFLIGMAGITDIVAVSHKEIRVIAFMGLMTDTAAANRDRAMDKFSLGDVLIMAEKTQIRALGPQLKLIRRLVRIVATGALALLDRRMDNLTGEFFVVAIVAEFPNVLDGFEFVGSGRLVAIGALLEGHRAVDKFRLAHIGMAFGSHTGLFFRCFYVYFGIGSSICGGRDIGTDAAAGNQKRERRGGREKGNEGQILLSFHQSS